MGICGTNSAKRQESYIDDKVILRGKIRKQVVVEQNANLKQQSHVVTGDKFLDINDAETIKDIMNIYTFREKRIGKGSFGSVMAAKLKYYGDDYDTNPSTAYAIKVINIFEPGLDETMLNNEISM